MMASVRAAACSSDLSGFTALTHLYKMHGETPNRWETSVTEYPRPTIWRTAPIVERGEIDTSLRQSESDLIKAGVADFSDVILDVYRRTNENYGTDVKPEVTDNH